MKKASRSIIYKEKESIRHFLGEGNTLERDFINKLGERPFYEKLKNGADDTLRLFNNACYICTHAFYDDYPPNELKEYEKIAIDSHDDPVWINHITPATMALIVNWLSSEECRKISEERGRREDIETLCRRIRVNIEDCNALPLESKEDFQALIIVEHQLPSGFINDGSFQRNSVPEAMENPSVKPFDILSSVDFFVDIIKNNPSELTAAIGPDSYFQKELPKMSASSVEGKFRELWEKLNMIFKDDNEQPPVEETAFSQSNLPHFTNRQMTILLTAVGRITEKDNPPGKTTLGDIVQRIAGYRPATASQNMKGEIPEKDKKIVADVLKSKFPRLAAEVMKVN